MTNYPTNQERTEEYFKKFNREKTLKHLINKQELNVIDVGANVGQTLKEFKQWWPKSIIHCFEPQEECWELLSKSAENFQHKDVYINKTAVGNEAGKELVFYSHNVSSGVSGFNKVNLNSNDSIRLKEVQNQNSLNAYAQTLNHERRIKTIRLDDYIVEKGVKHIDLLKIDTQGFEPEVLEGVGDQLRNVDVVLTELMFYDYYERSLSFLDIEQFLIPAGFRLYDINHISKNPMNGRTDWVDIIYVNKRLLNEE